MSRIQTFKSRMGAAVAALAATVAAAAVLASPASAASARGEAFLRPADHDKGRTLSGQGVRIVAGSGAGSANGMLSLSLDSLESSTAGSSAALSFERGSRSLPLTGISFDFADGTLNGTLGGQQLAVFNLGGAVSASAGTASLQGGKLSLTGAAATALKQKLGLERALVRRGVGMVWLAARATPAPAPVPIRPPASTRPVLSGSLSWGFLSSWRGYVLSPPAGSAEVSEGATATGALTSPATTYGFPVGTGTYTPGSNGGPAELSVAAQGSVKWAKPGHGIEEVRLSDLEVQIAPSGSWLIADVRAATGGPAKVADDIRLASLDLSGVTPSVGSSSLTWTAVPATLTAEGAVPFAGFYNEGKQLDPLTITVNLG